MKITQNEGALEIQVKIQPRAARNEVVGVLGEALKLRLTAPPVDGAANASCQSFLAQWLGVPKRAVTIISGHKSRIKTVRIEGLSREAFLMMVQSAREE
ncbi:MAG: DUF167 domain-containing protein [Bacillota bacterium]